MCGQCGQQIFHNADIKIEQDPDLRISGTIFGICRSLGGQQV